MRTPIWNLQCCSINCDFTYLQLIAGPVLSAIHIFSVVEEMRAAPVNTLNPQRTAMIVADFVKVPNSPFYLTYHACLCSAPDSCITNQNGKVSSPAELRYRENLLFPDRLIEEAGSVKVGQPLRKVLNKSSKLEELREIFPKEKFLISCNNLWTDLVLEQSATGEDALRGWLVAALAADMEKLGLGSSQTVLPAAYEKMESIFPSFLSEMKIRGWYTDQFLDGNGSRFAF